MKTISLKKVAVVAVASLGFGLLSVVPANAISQAAIYVSKYSSSSYTSADLTYDMISTGTTIDTVDGAGTATAEAHGLTASDIGKAIYSEDYGYIGTIASITDTNTFELTAAATQALLEAGTGDETKLHIGTPASTTTTNPVLNADQISGMTVTASATAALHIESIAANGTAANADAAGQVKILLNGVGHISSAVDNTTLPAFMVPFTAPAVPGTYSLTVKYSDDGTFDGLAANELQIGFTLTVVAGSAFSAGVSTVYINDDATGGDGATTAAVDALGATGPTTLTTEAAKIWLNLKKADGTTYSGGTLYAYMTGAGFLDIDGSTPVRSESAANDGNHYIIVEGDGTSGVGTVNIYIILADGTTKVDLPSKKVSFYGAVTKLEATVVQGIATAGTENGNCTALTDCTYATLAEKPAVLIKATDANGVLVPGLTVVATSTDSTIVASSSISGATGATDYNGAGYYNASVTGGSITGKSTTVTYSTYITASGVTIKSNAVTIANAGTPKVVTWATDKTTYAAGEKIVITVSAKDSSGNAAADGTYTLFSAATTLGGSFGGSVPGTSVELVGGKKDYTAFAPGTAGTYNLTSGGIAVGAAAGSKLTADLKVTDGTAALMTQIDALNAKIVALNALIAKIMKKLGVK